MKPRNLPPHKHKGVALITVLLVVAIVSLIAVQMSERLQVQLRRTSAMLTLNDAKWVNIGAEGFAKKVLDQDFSDSSEKSHLEQYWASGDVTFPLENGGMFSGRIKDLQGCFNLNGVVKLESEVAELRQTGERNLGAKQFLALLEALEVESYQAEIMADSLQDWLDADDYVDQSTGAEDSEYLSRSQPYLAANGPLADVGEMRAINGFTREAVKKIWNYVCVIPGTSRQQINVNTVEKAQVFMAMFTPNLTREQAEQLISDRPSDGYDSIEDFFASAALSGVGVTDRVKGQFTVLSEHFLVESETRLDSGTTLYTQSTLKRNSSEWAVTSRRFGGQGERVPDTEVSESGF
ncbi:type II secretion system minor pseudopilin GspK [Echinimonas agarilytica]|uniref:Type II secretion system protein K n=1 Tax=Echinimonas agarilytica TaxID=1215918 RepID=A0AA42B8I0_9GAMM|nr:type II secretion system minor pseudopilin GspK [Echinimonas agarilytica]MCM2680887.1 type II secretion system minor pseudopilin GspK [Echinimonas agarilytica]